MAGPSQPNPWDLLQPHDAARFGADIMDPKQRARWAGAIVTGGLPFMWREAAKIREMIYDRLELCAGDNVLLIGESNESCGFVADLAARIGPTGRVRSIDVIERARDMCFAFQRGKNGKLGTWRYDYVDDTPDDHYDAIVLLQGVQHTEDWVDTARQLVRVLKPGRRIAMGEIAFGPPILEKIRADVHIQYIFDKLFAAIGHPLADLSYWSADDLQRAFANLVIETGLFVDRGFECFWGRKPTATGPSR